MQDPLYVYLIFIFILLFHSFVGASRKRQLDKDILALWMLFESLSVTMEVLCFSQPF